MSRICRALSGYVNVWNGKTVGTTGVGNIEGMAGRLYFRAEVAVTKIGGALVRFSALILVPYVAMYQDLCIRRIVRSMSRIIQPPSFIFSVALLPMSDNAFFIIIFFA
jgi:hypothetical protein